VSFWLLVKNRNPMGRSCAISGQVKLDLPPSATIRRVESDPGFAFR
jgi:hypothetical protein